MDKRLLRAELRAKRRAFVQALDGAARDALLRRLADQVLAILPPCGLVASYCAVGSEIDPLYVAARVTDRLALPHFVMADADMAFRLSDGALEVGPWGIPQPSSTARPVDPDILLVPLVGADPHRNRLGQGKGHYDRALARLSNRKDVLTIGLAWDVQIVDRLPVDSWDVPLHLIVTPTRRIGRE